MIAVLQVDGLERGLLARLTDAGQMPAIASLLRQGTRHDLASPGTHFSAGAFPTLYTGVELGDHGLFYPFQWVADQQRVRPAGELPVPACLWERLALAGRRAVAIDPYESLPPEKAPGPMLSGWQIAERTVLPRWSEPSGLWGELARGLGRPPDVTEVFGSKRHRQLIRLRDQLSAGSARAADGAAKLLGDQDWDLAWIALNTAHIGGHQLLAGRTLEGTLSDTEHEELEDALPAVYRSLDAAIGRIVSGLPDDAELILVSVVGMAVNTSRADMLEGMLAAVLRDPAQSNNRVSGNGGGRGNEAGRNNGAGVGDRAGRRGVRGGDRGQGSTGVPGIWRLRSAVPPGVRGSVARLLPPGVALDLTARLELRGQDWSSTQAFVLPSDNQGYIRFNLAGRERDGIVNPGEVDELAARISQGLLDFRDPDGEPSVSAVDRTAEQFAGRRADWLPDLVVRWAPRSAVAIDHLVSPTHGKAWRQGVGSGRTGNHPEHDCWALLLGANARHRVPSRAPRLTDITATALALAGVEDGLPGEPLLER